LKFRELEVLKDVDKYEAWECDIQRKDRKHLQRLFRQNSLSDDPQPEYAYTQEKRNGLKCGNQDMNIHAFLSRFQWFIARIPV